MVDLSKPDPEARYQGYASSGRSPLRIFSPLLCHFKSPNSHQFAGSLVLFVRIAPTPHHGAGRTRHDHGGAGPPIAPLLSSPLLSSPLLSSQPPHTAVQHRPRRVLPRRVVGRRPSAAFEPPPRSRWAKQPPNALVRWSTRCAASPPRRVFRRGVASAAARRRSPRRTQPAWRE